jgi:hypothetical protein
MPGYLFLTKYDFVCINVEKSCKISVILLKLGRFHNKIEDEFLIDSLMLYIE